ncbi:cobalamin biosynthesis protein CobW [Rhizobium sp. SSA_523]|uniref:cobalamin biosynthesis protein CobW n=1 Tax=Rhizobium sp. SSA_523 TaxID=2952477 RepID=UPI002090AE24|nr:cobalamin biosynthesis protein CobW [Rhizobium sp. SSA_523]MCO5734515.1 cobalamin biosynthesis protein CobW [Rhizobium sp. SSA_523]WKC23243.1 cobalamin biosynthesis protein CobW [Rhizobium sp. SSA_523]
MTPSLTRVPCTVVTGFLGAGKTTLLRNALQTITGKRLAVIVNEFGDVGIDGEILKSCGIDSCPEDNIIELANGCICCTVADDFVPAIDKILAMEPRVDHILIETSGLALPKPLIQAFQWPSVKSRVTVDGVVAVVDGLALAQGRIADDLEALAAQRAEDQSLDHDDPVEEVFEDQIACADLVVLTKTDLLEPADLDRARAHIEDHLPRAVRIVTAENGAIDPTIFIGLGLAVEDDIENRKTHHDDELDHEHDDFDSFVLDIPAIASPEALSQRIQNVTETQKVLRIKGYVEVAGKPMRLLVQAVGPRVNHYFDRPWGSQEARRSRLVVIGEKGIDAAKISAVLAA